MRILGIVAAWLGLIGVGPAVAQTAAPFCLVSDSGQQSCFYYSLQACQQAAQSLGGMCAANSQAHQTRPPGVVVPHQQTSPMDMAEQVRLAGEAGRIRGEQQREARLRAELLEAQIARERAAAATKPETLDEESKASGYKMADDFAGCAGVWDFLAQHEEFGGRPASAKQATETSNGAMLAAAYIVSMIYHLENPQSQKTYGEFTPMFEGKRETSYTHMLAMAEREDVRGLEVRMTFCGGLLEAQEGIVSELRRSMMP